MTLNFSSNAASVDYEYNYFGLPSCYIIASTPRSGSTMLSNALWHTEMAGKPNEFLHKLHRSDYYKRFGFQNDAEYFDFLMKKRTSPNGIFGIKIHYSQFDEFGYNPSEIFKLLGLPKIIFIKRRAKIRQAISLYRAQNTKQFHVPLNADLPKSNDVHYIYDEIKYEFFRLIDEELEWEQTIKEFQLDTFELTYEELCSDKNMMFSKVLKFLSITKHFNFEHSLQQQADSLTDEWVERFKIDFRQEGYQFNG